MGIQSNKGILILDMRQESETEDGEFSFPYPKGWKIPAAALILFESLNSFYTFSFAFHISSRSAAAEKGSLLRSNSTH